MLALYTSILAVEPDSRSRRSHFVELLVDEETEIDDGLKEFDNAPAQGQRSVAELAGPTHSAQSEPTQHPPPPLAQPTGPSHARNPRTNGIKIFAPVLILPRQPHSNFARL
jgi:hypothetical protein